MRAIHVPLWCSVSIACLLAGCGDDLPKAMLITHMRVLGARTVVQGDPERSTPRPGETASVGWALAFPMLDQSATEVASLFITCTAPTRFTGVPICQEFIDAAQSPDEAVRAMLDDASMERVSCKETPDAAFAVGTLGAACVTGVPHIDVAVEAKTKVTKKLVRGIVCRNGIPALNPKNPQLFECDPKKGAKARDVEEIAVYGTIPIAHDSAEENDNPSMTDALFERGGKDWLSDAEVALGGDDPPLSVLDDDCVGAAKANQLHLSDGRDELFKLAFPADAREKVDGELETLELSAYATAGELSKRFVLFAPDAKVSKGLMRDAWAWKLSASEREEIRQKGKLVRFFFTIIDRRGGFDVAERSLCVTR